MQRSSRRGRASTPASGPSPVPCAADWVDGVAGASAGGTQRPGRGQWGRGAPGSPLRRAGSGPEAGPTHDPARSPRPSQAGPPSHGARGPATAGPGAKGKEAEGGGRRDREGGGRREGREGEEDGPVHSGKKQTSPLLKSGEPRGAGLRGAASARPPPCPAPLAAPAALLRAARAACGVQGTARRWGRGDGGRGRRRGAAGGGARAARRGRAGIAPVARYGRPAGAFKQPRTTSRRRGGVGARGEAGPLKRGARTAEGAPEPPVGPALRAGSARTSDGAARPFCSLGRPGPPSQPTPGALGGSALQRPRLLKGRGCTHDEGPRSQRLFCGRSLSQP